MRPALRFRGWLTVSWIGAVLAAEAPRTFPVGEFQFTRPEKWEWVEGTSAMRKAQLKVPGEAGQPTGEAVFFHLFKQMVEGALKQLGSRRSAPTRPGRGVARGPADGRIVFRLLTPSIPR
jgi:hypothetical protein